MLCRHEVCQRGTFRIWSVIADILKSCITILKSWNLFFFPPTSLSIEEAISVPLVVINARNKKIVKVF